MFVLDVIIDDGNEHHLTRHGVSITEVLQMLSSAPDIRRNRRGKTATHLARGRTAGGRLIMVAFVDLGDARARPIAAWEVGT